MQRHRPRRRGRGQPVPLPPRVHCQADRAQAARLTQAPFAHQTAIQTDQTHPVDPRQGQRQGFPRQQRGQPRQGQGQPPHHCIQPGRHGFHLRGEMGGKAVVQFRCGVRRSPGQGGAVGQGKDQRPRLRPVHQRHIGPDHLKGRILQQQAKGAGLFDKTGIAPACGPNPVGIVRQGRVQPGQRRIHQCGQHRAIGAGRAAVGRGGGGDAARGQHFHQPRQHGRRQHDQPQPIAAVLIQHQHQRAVGRQVHEFSQRHPVLCRARDIQRQPHRLARRPRERQPERALRPAQCRSTRRSPRRCPRSHAALRPRLRDLASQYLHLPPPDASVGSRLARRD